MRPNVIFGYSCAIPYLGDRDFIQTRDTRERFPKRMALSTPDMKLAIFRLRDAVQEKGGSSLYRISSGGRRSFRARSIVRLVRANMYR